MTKIYFRENGKTVVYVSNAKVTHVEALENIKANGHKPDGAVLLYEFA